IQAVATAAEAPTSEPSTPAVALTIALSMRSHIQCGWPLSQQVDEALPQLVDDMRLDLRRFQVSDSIDRLFAVCEIEHEHVVQVYESDGSGCSARQSVFLSTRSSRGRARRCASSTGDLQIILLLSHGFAFSLESS